MEEQMQKYGYKNRLKKTLAEIVLAATIGLSACSGGGSGSSQQGSSSGEQPQSAEYSVYGGEYNPNTRSWGYKVFIGSSNKTAEFELPVANIRDLEIISNEGVYIDAIEDLQKKQYPGIDSKGCYRFNLGTMGVTNWVNLLGPPDGYSAVTRSGVLMWLFGENGLNNGPGKDFKVHIGLQKDSPPYWGYGEQISNEDVAKIKQIWADFERGYETEDKNLILNHIKNGDFKTKTEAELDKIFGYYTQISIDTYDYNVVGSLPYAEIRHIADYKNIFSIDTLPPGGGGISDTLWIYFEKTGPGDWKVYHIPKVFNPHASMLCGTNR